MVAQTSTFAVSALPHGFGTANVHDLELLAASPSAAASDYLELRKQRTSLHGHLRLDLGTIGFLLMPIGAAGFAFSIWSLLVSAVGLGLSILHVREQAAGRPLGGVSSKKTSDRLIVTLDRAVSDLGEKWERMDRATRQTFLAIEIGTFARRRLLEVI